VPLGDPFWAIWAGPSFACRRRELLAQSEGFQGQLAMATEEDGVAEAAILRPIGSLGHVCHERH
jgi:hypothetical protein